MSETKTINKQQEIFSFYNEDVITVSVVNDEHTVEYTYHKQDDVISVRETIDGEVQETQMPVSHLFMLFELLQRSQLN